ncbi:MAG: hypothetical protein GW878_03795 [Acidobacteria bacterium]|nr:hypothetical protein [Acidobacteriota bacterium]
MALTGAGRLGWEPGLRHLSACLVLVGAAIALGEWPRGLRRWGRELLLVPFVLYAFLNLSPLIAIVNPAIRDPWLVAADRFLLGAELQAALYSATLPAWGADALTMCYASYFLLSSGLVIVLVLRGDTAIPRVTAAIVITFLVSYTGYFFVPAHGPRAMDLGVAKYAGLPVGIVDGDLRSLLDAGELTKTDAFPSGHTMVTLATLICARRRARTYYLVLLPVAMLLIAATVLLTYHYIVDLVAAVPLMGLALFVAGRLAGPVEPVSQ